MQDELILEIHDLSKHYDTAVALDRISLDVKKGEFLTFLGPSGSGKTTTLNLIAGFTDATNGSMVLNGEPLENLKAHDRNLGVVFQHYALFPHMTVADNVGYPLKQRKVSKEQRENQVKDALEMVRLTEYADRFPRQLSGGQQQRVALARALVYNPPILLMDEPLGALDKKLREWLQMELRRIHRELGSTFIYVTHDQEEALVLSDRIAVFNEGRIEQIGTAQELYTAPDTLFVGKFIGESSVLKGNFKDGVVTNENITMRTNSKIADGPAALLIRPEHLTVVARGQEAATEKEINRVPGIVEDIVYLGSAVKYTVQTTLGEAVARVSEEHAADVSIGAEIDVVWAIDDAILLVDDE